ncbi:MAG: hypothetical protein EA350_06195 [Gemmatimonadales bacterium]|nr:MAG: hypothetical protein EA350_06195 [Gemmatimonadales bacterium]
MQAGRRRVRAAGQTLGALLLLGIFLAGCDDAVTGGPWTGEGPPPPRALEASYFGGGVDLSWELDARWQNETFRVYSRRSGQASYVLVAEVTSCTQGVCRYRDLNVQPNRTYEYYVASFSARTGLETASEYAVEVFVPQAIAPQAPGGLRTAALDGAAYLSWDDRARAAEDFSFYRVYLKGGDGSVLLLGETDSEGFLDLLVENGSTYAYFVTSVDSQGHESQGSALVEVTPRPDFHGEFLYAFEDRPSLSGFRFPDSEDTNPVLPGTANDRDFRIEADAGGWWLVPGPGVEVHRSPIATSALRCGPAADAGCTEVTIAPSSNYGSGDIGLAPGFSYVLRMPDGAGNWYHGVVRITHTGFAQDGAIVIFDWAFQLQAGNPALTPAEGVPGLRRN